MPKRLPPLEEAGRAAYRKSLAANHAGTPCHDRRPRPLTPAKREELGRLYDIELQKMRSRP